MSDGTSPEDWCRILRHPCHFSPNIDVLSQPSSTIICIVLVVGYWLFGVMCLQEARSRILYGTCLIGFGFSVMFATFSYQALTWQIHCKYNPAPCVDETKEKSPILYDVDVNGCGIAYLVTQVLAFHILSVGDAYRAWRKFTLVSRIYGFIVTLLYLLWCVTVWYHGYKDLWSASLIAQAPALVIMFVMNGIVLFEWRLLGSWLILVASIVAYTCMNQYVDEEAVYESTGHWFHANDILHVVLILYPPLLWWAGGLAEDAPEGTFGITDDQAKGEAARPWLSRKFFGPSQRSLQLRATGQAPGQASGAQPIVQQRGFGDNPVTGYSLSSQVVEQQPMQPYPVQNAPNALPQNVAPFRQYPVYAPPPHI